MQMASVDTDDFPGVELPIRRALWLDLSYTMDGHNGLRGTVFSLFFCRILILERKRKRNKKA